MTIALFSQMLGTTANWKRVDRADVFSDKPYVEWSLEGSFKQGPSIPIVPAPVLILKCASGRRSLGYHAYKTGQLLSAQILVGSVLSSNQDGVSAMYRLDDGKPRSATFRASTSSKAVFIPESYVNDLLFGHVEQHRENSTPATKKVILMLDEFEAGHVVVQFDLPEPDEMAESCGLVYHRSK